MSRRRSILPLAGLILSAGTAVAAAPQPILVGTGPVAGFAYPLGGELCRLYEKEGREIAPCAVAATGGSVEDLRRLRVGEIQLAVVQSDLAAEATMATGPFAGGPAFPELRSIAGFYPEALTLLVRAGGFVKEVEDLKGKRIAVGEPGAPDPLFADFLDGLGWTKADLNGVVEMPRSDQIAALCAGKIDAIAVTAPQPNGFVRDVLAACPAAALDLAGPGLDAAVAAHHAYAQVSVDIGAYTGKRQVVRSFGPRAVLVTTAALNDEIVERLLTGMLGHMDALKHAHPAFSEIDQATIASVAGLGVERHEAAVKFLNGGKFSGSSTGD